MEEDRISQLPDEILQQILSLIDINEAVETAILSKRWKNLWCSLSDLHYHLSRVATHSRASLRSSEAAQAFSHRFSHFVSHFLSHRDGATTIRNLHLSFDSSQVHVDVAFVEKCVNYAIDHGVQFIHLHAHCSSALRLPAAFFASKTLRKLELRQFSCGIYVPGQFSLPHLKILYLDSTVLIKDDHFYTYSKEPFSGFPELEKLTILRCEVYELVVFAPKLRFLEIIQENPYSQVMEEISAPLLTWFRYEGHFPLECSKVNLPMLEEVYFDIYKRMNQRGVHLKCVRMLQQFGKAKIVTLTLDTLKVLEMDRDLIEKSPCPFPNMKCLKLMKGRYEIHTVLQSAMNYLTVGSLKFESLMVEFPHGVAVVEENSQDLSDDDCDSDELKFLFE